MKKRFIKSISVLLSLLMLLSCMSVLAFAENETEQVFFSAYNGLILMPKQVLSVEDGIAEKYGYTPAEVDHNGEAINGLTALDVLVAAHEKYYGEDFTSETAKNYLEVSQYGYVTEAFGEDATGGSFSVNNTCPHDDVFNPSWGSYTGYSINEARISDGDSMMFMTYQDTMYYADYVSWFDTESITFTDSGTVELTLSGYGFMWYGCSPSVEEHTSALSGVDVYVRDENDIYTLIGATDENGKITVSFDKTGKYQIVAMGTTEDEYGEEVYVFPSWCDVSVNAHTPTFLEKIKAFFQMIIDFFKSIFKRA